MKKFTFWSLILALPVIASAYTAAASLGMQLPRPFWNNEGAALEYKILLVGADVLSIWEQRLTDLEIKASQYEYNNQPVPAWIIREIKSLKAKIAQRKKDLGLN